MQHLNCKLLDQTIKGKVMCYATMSVLQVSTNTVDKNTIFSGYNGNNLTSYRRVVTRKAITWIFTAFKTLTLRMYKKKFVNVLLIRCETLAEIYLPCKIFIFYSLLLCEGYKSWSHNVMWKTYKTDREILYICKTNGTTKLLITF